LSGSWPAQMMMLSTSSTDFVLLPSLAFVVMCKPV